MPKLHTHECVDCGTDIPCDSAVVPDYDGSQPHCALEWAEVGEDFLCDDCQEVRQQVIRDEARTENDR